MVYDVHEVYDLYRWLGFHNRLGDEYNHRAKKDSTKVLSRTRLQSIDTIPPVT